ncbi:hypothetical protein L484_007314 [Morus notabilis]|uniref:Uncharacterized protein n=1 Tax=Morus notabilis TaxID=981085 RepID=W9REQ5_9ROSA|nr:hypothetical protein L484_007314 [Morus notabilis]
MGTRGTIKIYMSYDIMHLKNLSLYHTAKEIESHLWHVYSQTGPLTHFPDDHLLHSESTGDLNNGTSSQSQDNIVKFRSNRHYFMPI